MIEITQKQRLALKQVMIMNISWRKIHSEPEGGQHRNNLSLDCFQCNVFKYRCVRD